MIEGAIRFMIYEPAASADNLNELESRAITGGSFESTTASVLLCVYVFMSLKVSNDAHS